MLRETPNSITEKKAVSALIETSLASRSPQFLSLPRLEAWTRKDRSSKENIEKEFTVKINNSNSAKAPSPIPLGLSRNLRKDKSNCEIAYTKRELINRRSSELLSRSKTVKSIVPVVISLNHDMSNFGDYHGNKGFVIQKIKNRLKCIMIKNHLASQFKLNSFRRTSISQREVPGFKVKKL